MLHEVAGTVQAARLDALRVDFALHLVPQRLRILRLQRLQPSVVVTVLLVRVALLQLPVFMLQLGHRVGVENALLHGRGVVRTVTDVVTNSRELRTGSLRGRTCLLKL